MKIHRLVAFLVRPMLRETRVPSFDLNATASFLLDVLHISASVSYHLCSQIKTRNRFKVDRDTFLGPFTLCRKSASILGSYSDSNPAKLVTLYLVRLSAPESSLVD